MIDRMKLQELRAFCDRVRFVNAKVKLQAVEMPAVVTLEVSDVRDLLDMSDAYIDGTCLTIRPRRPDGKLHCSFCGRSQTETKLVAGPSIYVCLECVELCLAILK